MITAFCYKKDEPFKANATRAEMLTALKDKTSLLWVDLEDPSEFESDCLVEIFNFHDLAIEDCLVDHSEPKVDDYEEYLFLVTHAALTKQNEEKGQEEFTTSELEIFFGPNYVVTFHKTPVKTVSALRELVRKKPDLHMGHGSDLLTHALLDHLVDNYQPVLDFYDQKIDKLEEEIFNNPPNDYLATMMQVKQDMFVLRRTVASQRDIVNYLTKNTVPFIRVKHRIYFKDIYDHLIRIYGRADGYHESLAYILQAYFSYSSHKLNEVVKHMTVMATVSMPLIIVASIYGMNFQHMPELDWKWGYPFALILSLGISGAVLVWMKLKKWL